MNRILNGCVACLFLVTLFFTVVSGPVFAGDKDCDDPKWADHPICTGGDPDPDPGDEIMTLENVYGWWSGDVHDQLDDGTGTPYFGRFCNASGNITNSDVKYGCPNENQVHFILPSPDEAIGKEKELCSDYLDDFLIGGSNADTGFGRITAYHFNMDPTLNNGKCGGSEPSCLIRVRMTAYFDNWCNSRKCGRLVLIRGWGNAEPAGVHPSGQTELNPFYYDQAINIDDLEIFFMGIGTNRDVAECHWYNSGVQFITDNPNR